MQTDDIAVWLTAIWDEQEEAARAAYYENQVWLPEEESVISAPDWDVVHTADRKVDARHIVEWPPALVLARIAADRQILAWCTEREQVYVGTLGDDPSDPKNYVPGALRHSADSVVVRLLALPHADRPGYNEQWRP